MRLPAAPPQPYFQRCQRTSNAQPRLRRHHADGGKMDEAKPQIARPPPTAKAANDNADKRDDDENDKRRVEG